ncbi:hypothetical protein [Corynebacterium urinipleomorphum]|uniref:hypothetical protein n=1 Tax=Corynebacterium urinipleomorphum TaxID=1852380 RepID=UPI000B354147|nr:hypothetical protein [Corynebacterium urinipleomorphum]
MNQKTTEAPTCQYCSKEIQRTPGRGRPRKYCSDSCKQRAYELRHPASASREGARRVSDNTLRDKLFELRCAAEDIAIATNEGADANEIQSLCDELVTMAKKLERLQ